MLVLFRHCVALWSRGLLRQARPRVFRRPHTGGNGTPCIRTHYTHVTNAEKCMGWQLCPTLVIAKSRLNGTSAQTCPPWYRDAFYHKKFCPFAHVPWFVNWYNCIICGRVLVKKKKKKLRDSLFLWQTYCNIIFSSHCEKKVLYFRKAIF